MERSRFRQDRPPARSPCRQTDDTVYNVALNMSMTLSSPTNATIATSVGTGTINNIDSQPSILINDVTANEGSADTFTVSLSNASYQSISVQYATSNGTAVAGTNYTAKSGTLTIPAGSTSGTVSVTNIDDGVYAATGLTFNLNLTSPTNATIADNLGIGTITNIDGQPTVQFTASTQSVNQSPSTQTVTVTAQLSAAANSNTTVTIPLTLTGTATSGTDYTISPTSITIAGGSTTGTTTLTITNSGTPGADKTAILTMGTPTNAGLGSTTAQTVTIVNNNYPSVNFSVASQDVAINQGTATVNVTLSTAPTKTVTVPITISGSSTAVANTDYTLTAPTLTFTSGVTSQSFTYTILDQASPATANATLILGLGSITNGTAGGTATQTSTIRSPSLDLNFAAMYDPVNQMSQAPYNQITFTRASTATYMDCDGVMKTAAVNVPRIDCNPVTGQPNGLLIEEARTNLLSQSSAFAAYWGLNSVETITDNQALAPDGTNTAALVSNANSSSSAYRFVATAVGTYTLSAYLKKGNSTSANLQINTPSGGNYCDVALNFDTAIASVWFGTCSNLVVQNLSNGWYRLAFTVTAASAGSSVIYIENSTTSSNSQFYIWGVQLEQGAFPTSYIPTTTAAVTRSAESATVSASGWYNSSVGTWFDQFVPYEIPTGATQGITTIDDGTANNYVELYRDSGGNYGVYKNVVSGTQVTRLGSVGTVPANSTARIVSTNQNSDFATSVSGATLLTQATGNLATALSTLRVGQQAVGGAYLDGAIGRVAYYSKRIPNSLIQTWSNTANAYRTYTPTANLTFTSQTVIEPQGTVYVTAALSEPATSTITVPYIVGGTAVSGINYSGLTSGNFTFAAGQSRSGLAFTLNDDGTSTNPTITVTLSSGTGYSLGTQTAQTITIQRPSLDLNFAAMYSPASQISTSPYNAITFTRASAASYVDATGVIAYAASNVPRIDYNPTTHQPNGLLIEESRANSALQSNALSNASWTKSDVSIGSTPILAPDGSLSAYKLIENNDSGTSSSHAVYQASTATVAQTWSASVYVQAAERTQVQLAIYNNGATANNVQAIYNLSGVGSVYSSTNVGNGTGKVASIQAFANNWYRVSLSGTPDTSGTVVRLQVYPVSGNTPTYASTGSSGLYLWGAQLEAGAFPTSYIATTTAAVTRAADSASINSLGWLNSSLGSFVAAFNIPIQDSACNNHFFFDLETNTSNREGMRTDGCFGSQWNEIVSGGSGQSAHSANSILQFNAIGRVASAYQTNDLAAAYNGSVFGRVTSGVTVPTVNQLNLGSYAGASAAYLDGGLNRMTYYPVRLSNQQLQIVSNQNQFSLRISTPTVTLRTASQSVLQSGGQAFFVAVLSQPAMGPITVPYTISGTATSGTDYSGLTSGTLTFTSGQSVALTSFNVLTTTSTNKTVIMTLGAPSGATLGTYSAETIYVTNATTGLTLTSSTVNNNGSTVTFSGACGPGETITISGQQSATTTCTAGGTWTWTSSTISTDGSYSFSFTQSDGTNSGTAVAGTYNRDTTAPTAVATFLDGNTTSSLTTSPVMTWSASTDSGAGASGIAYYLLALGTTAGGTDIVGYTNVGNTALYQFTGLSLTNGTMYYGSIKAVDNAGNISAVTQGDGFAVVTDMPTLGLNFTNNTTIANGTALTSTNTSYPAMVQFSNAAGAGITAPMFYNSSGVLTAAAENIISYSTVTTSAPWTSSNSAVVSASTSAAPDGTISGTSLGYGGVANPSYFQDVTVPNDGVTRTISIYVKSVSSNSITLFMFYRGAGTLTGTSLGMNPATGNITAQFAPQSGVIPVGNGWYRIWLALANNSSGNTSARLQVTTQDTGSTLLWGAQLETGSTPSSYIYTTSAPAYGPRFDYNPSTLTLNGLLIEESRTNLVYPSVNWITGTAVSGSQDGVTQNASSAPDGTNTATNFIPGTFSSPNHYTYKTYPGSASTTYTHSVYAKANGYSGISIALGNNAFATDYMTTVDLSTGTITDTTSGATSSLASAGNGWYRISITATSLASPGPNFVPVFWIWPTASSVNAWFTGDGTSGVLLWGEQVEQGAMPTSYIPTTTTAMTRSADQAMVPVTSSSWFNTAQGSLVGNFKMPFTSITNQFVADFDDGTGSNRIGSYVDNLSNIHYEIYAGGIGQSGSAIAGVGVNSANTFGFGYQNSNFAHSLNASSPSVGMSGTVPSISKLEIGQYASGNFFTNGWIQSLNYYNTRLSNSAIQELTHP